MMNWPTEKLKDIANAAADAAKRVLHRAETFVPVLDGKPQCP
jgi:hypothetical protein